MNGVINPYIAGSPVRERSMFFGRTLLFETIRQCLVESSPAQLVILHGQRRMGKTSTLYQMSYHLPARYVPVLVDLQGISLDGLSSLLWEMAQVIRRRLRRDAAIALPRADRRSWFSDPLSEIGHFFDAMRESIGTRHVLLMFDETILLVDKIEAGALDARVFDCLADLMLRYPFLDSVFSIGSRVDLMEKEIARLSRQAMYCELGFLEPEEARALICEPVRGTFSYQEPAVDHILAMTAGQPYYTQLVCHQLFNHMHAAGRSTVTCDDVAAIRADVIEMATAQFHYVWDETPPLGQRVLLALAQDRGVQPSPIDPLLRRHGIVAIEDEIKDCLTELTNRYIIEGTERHPFRIGLFRDWILEHQHLQWT